MKKNTNLKIIALSFVPFIMVLGNSMLIPILTNIKKELHISQYEANLLISYFSFPAAVLIPFLGFLSDRIGRKKILIPSLILYGLGGVISGFSTVLFPEKYHYILLGRVVQGFGAAGTSPIAMTLVSDIFSSTERSKALGIIEASNGVGKVISPILGSMIALIAWYMIFFSYSVLTIPIALLIWFIIKEEKNFAEGKNLKLYFKEIFILLKDKHFSLIMCLLIGFFSLFILYGILANISEIFGENSQNLIKKGFFVALPLLTMSMVSYWFGGYLQNKQGMYKVAIVISLLVCVIGIGIMPFFTKTIYKFIILEGIGVAVGTMLTALNTLVTSCVPPGKRGMVTALYNSFRFLGISFGPIFFSGVYKHFIQLTGFLIVLIISAVVFEVYVKSDLMLVYFGDKKN